MPGPLLAITISESAKRGFWAGPRLILGHGILELALIAALAAGLSKFMDNEFVLAIVGVVGGVILLGMGSLTVWRGSQKTTALPSAEPQQASRSGRLVITGILGSISNPYWFIWWVTLGTTYLVWSFSLGIAGIASFFTGHILADLLWYALVAFVVATGRKIMNDVAYRILLVVCGVALLGLGGYFLVSSSGFFMG